MTRRPRAPSPPASPEDRLDNAIAHIAGGIAVLIQLTADDRTVPARRIDLLRTRRQQLSAVIDRLTPACVPRPPTAKPTRAHTVPTLPTPSP
jgi:hypothetical protein